MLKRSLSIVFAILLSQLSVSQVYAAPQGEEEARQLAKLKQQVAKRVADKKTKVKIKLRDGTQMQGEIQQAAAENFVVRNKKTGDETTIAYREVAKLRGRGLSKGAKIGIVAAAVIGVAVIVAAIILPGELDDFTGFSIPIVIK